MFGRLANVRIKSAEDAFQAGRLDDALEIACSGDLSTHGRIRKLLDQLGQAFLDRGQDLLLGKRFAEAVSDFEKAARCGHDPEKAEVWRLRAQEAVRADEDAVANRRAALREARERIDAGSLLGAENALGAIPADDPDRAAISGAIKHKRQKAQAFLDAAAAALKDDNISLAVAQYAKAQAMHNRLDGIEKMEDRIVDQVVKKAFDGFRNGRLDRAGQDLAALGEVGRGRTEVMELRDAIDLASDAAKALNEDRYAKAGVLLGRLAKMNPKSSWISEVRKHLKVMEDHRRLLLEGPLGLLLGQEVPSKIRDRSVISDETLPANHANAPGLPPVVHQERVDKASGIPRRMMLRIDGVGSFMLVRGDRISIGRGGPGATADIPLMSDLSERHAEVVRAGEDYFIVSQSGVELAGNQVDHALLQEGDRIRLGKRVKLKFRRPSLKSSAAVLDLGEGVRMSNDCRRVILWAGPVLMGGTRECHIHLGRGLGDFVLIERGGKLYVKPMGVSGAATPVQLDEQVAVGEFRFSIVDWSGQSRTGRVFG